MMRITSVNIEVRIGTEINGKNHDFVKLRSDQQWMEFTDAGGLQQVPQSVQKELDAYIDRHYKGFAKK